MSSESNFVLFSALQGFSLQPIANAVESIFSDLTLLLTVDSLLGADATKGLECVLDQIINAVKHNCIVLHYFRLGLSGLQQMLSSWDSEAPFMKLDQFLMAVKHLQYACANATDAQMAYADARQDVESLLERYVTVFSSDVVVEVTSKKIAGQLHIQKSTLKNMGNNAIDHLEKSEAATLACVHLLEDINKFLIGFLADEQVSLMQPLAMLPAWSSNPVEAWESLNFEIVSVENKLTGNIQTNPSWFKWSHEDKKAYLQKDRESRKSLVTTPDVRLQLPADKMNMMEIMGAPGWPQTPIPSRIIEAPIEPSGIC